MMKKIFLAFIPLILFLSGCSVYKSLVNLSRLQFKLNGVQSVAVGGVSLQGKQKISDFSVKEVLAFTTAVAKGNLPITFTLNVAAKNPNDGSGGYAKTNASIESFPYRLLLDNKEVLSGNFAQSVSVPGTGESVIIPLQVSFDLVQTFKNQGYESLLNLALSIAGYSNQKTEIVVFSKPVVKTDLGNLSYPSELKIVDYEFSSK